MEEFLGKIYCWFDSLFGQNLAQHLWGYNCLTEVYDGKILFNSIGLITVIITLVFVLLYYYLPIPGLNHPRSNRWWNWLIILLVAGVINLFIGYAWTLHDFLSGNIGDCLMYTRDATGNIVSQLITKGDCWIFGMTNFIVSMLFFVLFSFIFKWKSRNCKHSPVL